MPLNTERYEGARQKADLASIVLQDVGMVRHVTLLDAIAKGLLSDPYIISTRIVVTNTSNIVLSSSVWWRRQVDGELEQVESTGSSLVMEMDREPWLQMSMPAELRKITPPVIGNTSAQLGSWTFPYYSCLQKQWILSYTVHIGVPPGRHG